MRKKISFLFLFLFIVAGFLFWHFKYQTVQKNNFAADILITNAEVLTLDARSDVYNPGWLAIKDGKILSLGGGRPPSGISAPKIIDASGKLVMPGLVNTHSHSAMTLLLGLGKNQALRSWLTTMSQYEANFTPDDVYWGTLLAEDKMIKSGTTVFNDMYFFPEQAAAAANVSGTLNYETPIAHRQNYQPSQKQPLSMFRG